MPYHFSVKRLRHRSLVLTAIALACGACADRSPASVPVVTAPSDTSVALPTRMLSVARADTLARDLVVPWGIAFTPDGALLVTERAGRIRRIVPDSGVATLWAEIADVYAEQPGIGPESGLLGIALDPAFETTRRVFVAATTWRSEGDRSNKLATRLWRRVAVTFDPLASLSYEDRILRLTDQDGKGVDQSVVVNGLATNYYHAGGGLAFGPDGQLYFGIGDALRSPLAQDPERLVGKILRYRADGSPSGVSSAEQSPVFALGLRNTQAFTWLPDGALLGVDHGPTGLPHEGGRGGRDELNVIRPGANYGWPLVVGWETAEGLTPPIWVWHEAIAPGGITLYREPDGTWDGTVLVAGLRGRLEQLTLRHEDGAWRVTERGSILNGEYGRLRAVQQGPDGRVYLTTSNRDARGQPRPGDDLVVRLTLAR